MTVPSKLTKAQKREALEEFQKATDDATRATGCSREPSSIGSAGERRTPRYMICVAAELVGMHPQTLRIYEQKGLVRPKRTAGNTRLYSDADVERLRLIQRLTTELGLNLAGVEQVLHLEDELAAHAPPARPDGARDARGDRPGAPAVPARPRPLPARRNHPYDARSMR